jgi:tripartite-type tricarboxylate transporter receptor subunit TctC
MDLLQAVLRLAGRASLRCWSLWRVIPKQGDAMKLSRRRLVHVAAGAATLPMLPSRARAQAYPSRPVHLLEGFGAGGAPDIIARLMGEWLGERLGRPFVIENRSGAAGKIATDLVAKASPDGHTLLLITAVNAIDTAFGDKLSYDFLRDIVPVAGIYRVRYVMEVHPSVPANTVAEFIAYAKANPGKVNMGSAGTGTGTHVTGELFKMMSGLDLYHVPYRGAQAIQGIVVGQVQVYFGVVSSSLGHIKGGRLRGLAVTTATRSAVLPEIPALNEFLPGYEASAWYGPGAPRGTPPEIVSRLNREVNAVLAIPRPRRALRIRAVRSFPGRLPSSASSSAPRLKSGGR